MSTTTPRPGDLIAGRYRLLEQIGEGSAATVFRAADEALGRDVAVKILRPALAAVPAAAARFRAEGRAAAIVAHPNIAAVFDVAPEGEAPAIIMEFVDGEDLTSMLRRVGPLVPRRAAAIAAQVARGLAAAHARGIIHRDLSSRNILISREGRAQIADFGIAHTLLEAPVDGASGAPSPEGTLAYLAPEVLAGERATTAADLYGLGVVLYELLTGRRPQPSAADAAPPSPRLFRPDIPVVLDAIAVRLLAAKPSDRPASATVAADALESFVVAESRTSIPQRAVGPAAGAPRALAGTRVSRVAGQAGPGEPDTVPDASDVQPFADAGDESISNRSLLLTIAGVSGVVVLLVAGVILGLRLITAGGGADKSAKVPPLATLTLGEAIPIAEQLGLKVKVVERVTSDSYPVDTILSQSPEPGTLVPINTAIEVRVVMGSGLAVVPDILGFTLDEARKRLREMGLTLGQTIDAISTTAPPGTVVQQNPRGGLQVAKGTSVDLVFSIGPSASPTDSIAPSPGSEVVVPDLYCLTVADAAMALAANGLMLDAASTALPQGEYINAQSVAPGTIVAVGTAIGVTPATPAGVKPSACP